MADDKKKDPKPPVVVPDKSETGKKLGFDRPRTTTTDSGEKRGFNDGDKKK
jgi:hypothetical protein